ncbi:MAG: hypothetical protein LH603_10935 [Pseudonocardia sp.]|nr:hypothetical protein [Pseudonocardia sp.]
MDGATMAVPAAPPRVGIALAAKITRGVWLAITADGIELINLSGTPAITRYRYRLDNHLNHPTTGTVELGAQ